MTEYEVITHLTIECNPLDRTTIQEEIMYAMIAIVEAYNAFIGGGIEFREYKDE